MKTPPNHICRAWPGLFWRFWWALWLGTSLQAGEYSVTTWGVDEGLPQSSVTDIAQTSDGYLWIRSLNSSFSRFDGVQFVNFDPANLAGLVTPAVRHLLVGGQGNLWVNDEADNLLLWQGNCFVKVGENLRLALLVAEQPGQVAFTAVNGDLITGRADAVGRWTWQRLKPPMPITSYFEDRDRVLWFLAPGGKIGRLESDRFEILNPLPGLAGQNLQVITRDSSGNIWLGTDKELARWDQGTFTNLNPGGAAEKISVRRLLPATGGGLWLMLADGKLIYYDHERWSQPVVGWDGNRVPWSRFRSWRSDNLGGVWITLGDEGLAHVDRDGQLVRVTGADGLPSMTAQAFFADREGNLWAGFHRGGLLQLRKETFHAVTRRDGLQDSLVTSVTEDASGTIWLGAAGGSVTRWADGVCTNLSLPLRGRFCQNAVVAAGADGRVWIGTGGNGLLVWNQGELRHALLPEQIPQSDQQGVRQLLVAKNGDVWFANFSGLYRFDGKELHCEVAPKSKEQAVASLAEGTNGTIWFGTFDGVLRRWQEGKLFSYQPSDNAAPSRLWALWPEADGTIWIGTMNSGLLRFKDGKFTRFTTADGLADNYISHILADDHDNLWLGSHVGVMCVAKRSLRPRESGKEPVACRLFGRSDGLPTVAMTLEFQPSCVRALDGALWFGSPKGASWVNPEDVRPVQPAPRTLIESILADNTAREFSPVSSHRALPAISVEPGVKNLEVRFTSPVFTDADLMRFKYRLDKLDPDWIDLGARRSVTFNHLPAGEYTFRVMAKNSDGLWGQKPAAFRLVLQPYFWERKSFLVAALVALLGVVAFSVRRITKQRLRRKFEALRQQQQIERERARIAQDLHDDLGAGLTQISMTSDLVENPDLPEYEKGQYAHEVGVRARELVQRMDEIVWAVNPRNDSVASLSLYACQYAKQFLELLNIACRVDLQPGLPEIPLNAEQRYNFFLAFKEAVNNIARHSGATELHLTIRTEDGQLVFLLQDNGRGFEAGGELVGADGLRNIRERITRMGGECEITSRTGQGTRVAMRVPLAPEARPV